MHSSQLLENQEAVFITGNINAQFEVVRESRSSLYNKRRLSAQFAVVRESRSSL